MKENQQSSYWFLTINPSASCYETFKQTLKDIEFLNPNCEYSYILHDFKEDNDDVGHYHVVLYNKGKKQRFSTLRSMFVGAHIEQTNKLRYVRCLQYLIHKNDEKKKQYCFDEIVSNIAKMELVERLSGTGYEFDIFDSQLIYDYLDDAYSKNELNIHYFVKRFGLGGIKDIYFVLKDYVKEYYNTIMAGEFVCKSDIEIAWDEERKKLKYEYNLARLYKAIPSTCSYDDFEREEQDKFFERYEIEKGDYF